MQLFFDSWRGIRSQLRQLQVNPDKTVFVRIPTQRAFGLRDKWDKLNDNDVRVLLAITSKLGGEKAFAVVTREEIAWRATGAKDEKQWEHFGRPPLLSEDQITRSIHKVAEQWELVSRVRARKGRLNYFSHKLTPKEL